MKTECSTCGGTGQVGFFQGVSRFLITWEECPQCLGTGQVDQDKDETVLGKGRNKGPGKTKKS